VTKPLVYIDAQGNPQAADLTIEMYRDASASGVSLRQHLATVYPTNDTKYGSAYAQFLEQCGIFVKADKDLGLRPSSMDTVLNPSKDAASAITKDGIPASRILFPAVFLEVIESKLQVDYATNPNALNSMIAVTDSIQGDRWERPVIDYTLVEGARAKPVSQLAVPDVMMTITASDKGMRIPSWAIGMEISEQALRSTTIDLVGLAVARQAAVEGNERANNYILSLLNGDADLGMVALSTLSGKVTKASSYDSTIVAAGALTQKAWMSWIGNPQRANKRVITHIVTDLATALAIENRSGKPVVTTDNPTSSRIDTLMQIINPTWTENVKIFLSNDPNWPANTIMGLDSRYAIHRVNSLTAQYSAVEQFVLKRSTAMRFDRGELLYRLFDDAFDVLTLIP